MAIITQWAKDSETAETPSKTAYQLAAFIMGSLIAEQVIQFKGNDSDSASDLDCGIRVIAACLKDTLPPDIPVQLPFRW